MRGQLGKVYHLHHLLTPLSQGLVTRVRLLFALNHSRSLVSRIVTAFQHFVSQPDQFAV